MSADWGDFTDSGSTASAASSSEGQSFWGFYDLGGSLVQNEMNRKESHSNRDFQKMMSDTSWTRGVNDMINAGINPMLAASKGGASSPEGSVARMESATHNSAQTGMQSRLLSAQLDKMGAETRNVNAEADRNEQIASIIKSVGPRIVQGVGGVESAAGSLGAGVAKLEGIIREALKDFPGNLGPMVEDIIRRLTPEMNLPGGVLLNKAKQVIKDRANMPSPVTHHPAWGVGDYERAQAERFKRARQSPASIRRSGGN